MPRLKKVVLGRSIQRHVISAYWRAGHRRDTTLVLAGMHGDEPKSVHVANELLHLLDQEPDAAPKTNWIIVPVVNPDGCDNRHRRNARGVDINRNFPTKNWAESSPRSRMYGGPRPASEPETRVVIRTVEMYHPDRIITIHSIDRGRHCNNYDGPGRGMARRMARWNGYPVRSSIGYPTPGSFGTWAGAERGIPTLTLELPAPDSAKKCWERNRDALLST
jgi:protein MpaA